MCIPTSAVPTGDKDPKLQSRRRLGPWLSALLCCGDLRRSLSRRGDNVYPTGPLRDPKQWKFLTPSGSLISEIAAILFYLFFLCLFESKKCSLPKYNL